MIENADYFVRLVPFPSAANCNGMVLLNDDGTYSVYLNSKASHSAIKKAMRHEYSHMANDDLYNDKDIGSIEAL